VLSFAYKEAAGISRSSTDSWRRVRAAQQARRNPSCCLYKGLQPFTGKAKEIHPSRPHEGSQLRAPNAPRLRQGDHAARPHQGHHAAAGQDASTSTVVKKASQDSSQAGRRRPEVHRVGGHPPNIILHRHDLSRNCIWLANHAWPIGSRQQGAIYQRPGAGRLPATEGGSSRLRRRSRSYSSTAHEAGSFRPSHGEDGYH
jgi:hypothetical protein